MEFSNVDKPGWYLHHHLPESERNPSFLAHVVDEAGTCKEQMTFTRQGGKITPIVFMIAAGVTGRISSTGQSLPLDVGSATCNLEDPSSLGIGGPYDYVLSGKLSYYRDELELMIEGQTTPVEFSAFFASDGKTDTFIVRHDLLGLGFWENSEGENQTITSNSSWDIFDLANGRLLSTREEITLANGDVIHK